jgi:DNA-binding MarR family transcriptional regulator
MAKLAQRGPFLLLFALNQQLGALLSQAMAGAPLTPPDFAVCSALRLMQPTTLTELASTLGMRPTTLSSTLTRLEQQGHLTRQPNPADGRSRLISLTSGGQEATEGCFPSFGAAIQAFLQHLDVPQAPLLDHFEAAARALQAAAGELAARAAQATPAAREQAS